MGWLLATVIEFEFGFEFAIEFEFSIEFEFGNGVNSHLLINNRHIMHLSKFNF